MDPLPRPARRPTAPADRPQSVEPVDVERRQIEHEMDRLLAQILAQREAEPENFSGREQLYAAHHALRARRKVLDRS
jgi:hypothetical protein